MDVLASLIIKDEGPSPINALKRRWSLNLVVRGKAWRIGSLVNGQDEKDATAKFAAMLGR
jgi:hypothetical protein